MYKNGVTVNDCTGAGGLCQKEKLWFNGYIAPSKIGGSTGVSGLPSGSVANQATSPAYLSPINNLAGNNNVDIHGSTNFLGQPFAPSPSNFGSNPYSRTVLNGPNNYNVDLSVFKVFPITESTFLRFNVDAFNALNIQGFQNPNITSGEIAYQPNGLSTSYWTPRQLQFTLRLQF
jgi:hypothetical protein